MWNAVFTASGRRTMVADSMREAGAARPYSARLLDKLYAFGYRGCRPVCSSLMKAAHTKGCVQYLRQACGRHLRELPRCAVHRSRNVRGAHTHHRHTILWAA